MKSVWKNMEQIVSSFLALQENILGKQTDLNKTMKLQDKKYIRTFWKISENFGIKQELAGGVWISQNTSKLLEEANKKNN